MFGSTKARTTEPKLPGGSEADLPVEDHAVIGDLRTVALIAKDGCISFMCVPDFDSPTVFARLLDPTGGTFRVSPVDEATRSAQRYLPDTNVLVTRLSTAAGLAEATDWMPVRPGREQTDSAVCQYLVRQLRVLRGSFEFDLLCAPRFDYGRSGHSFEFVVGGHVKFTPESNHPVLVLQSSVPLAQDGGDARARFTLGAGQTACFVLMFAPSDPAAPLDEAAVDESFRDTVRWWQNWLAGSRYRGRWREMVDRSALLLKLMTSARYGAMVAAPTFGLPERAGGHKNWDYRYCWIRDTSFAMYAFVRLGLVQEMSEFVDWIGDRVRDCAQAPNSVPLGIMYGLDGRTSLAEEELDGLRGWAGSRPVRVGNAAANQLQLDIYGELTDAMYLANKYVRGASYDGWQNMSRMVEWVRDHWREPDQGIWETRGDPQEYLYSRLMCWVTLDRAIRLAQKRSFPAPLPEWNQTRLEIYGSIHNEFWDSGLNSFVDAKGSRTVDGAMLLMPLLRFISPTDPRWLGTMEQIRRQLVVDALVFRRSPGEEPDEPGGEEGSFLACSFWYVEALARSGQVAEARLVFDKLVGYANHVGLYAEELSFSGRHLGNFPQVLTHLALISAASYLDRSLGGERTGQWA